MPLCNTCLGVTLDAAAAGTTEWRRITATPRACAFCAPNLFAVIVTIDACVHVPTGGCHPSWRWCCCRCCEVLGIFFLVWAAVDAAAAVARACHVTYNDMPLACHVTYSVSGRRSCASCLRRRAWLKRSACARVLVTSVAGFHWFMNERAACDAREF